MIINEQHLRTAYLMITLLSANFSTSEETN